MSDDAIIQVEGLGKKYSIRHQRNERYATFRDVLASRAKSLFRRNGGSQLSAFSSQLSKEDFWALRNVSFEVKQGEVLGIIGRNGAGKSTLLKILSRITEPTEGRVRLKGRVASLLEVGTGFHPELTGRENIFLNGAILGMSRNEIKAKFDEIVAFAETEKFLDTPVKRYSSGMYVRLAFAVAAHLDCEILLVDEVLAVGDADFQRKCLNRMQEVSTRQGRTVLVVSHFMENVKRLCRKGLFLQLGKAEFSDDVNIAIERYLGRDESGIAEWKNQNNQFDNPYFQPFRFWLSRRDGTIEGVFSRKDEITFNVTGFVKCFHEATHVGITISHNSDVVLWSFHNDVFSSSKFLKPGVITLRCTLPAYFLNEGKYRVDLICGVTFIRWLFGGPGDSSPAVELTVSGGFSTSPYWVARRPGVVAPLFDWHLEQ